MKKTSIWKEINSKDYPKLNKNIEVDVIIIGGGITGISTLYHLNNSNLKVTLIEQNKIGMSTTGNSTGKLTYLQNDLLYKIKTNFSDNTLKEYIKIQIETINNIVNTIKSEKIKCDLQKTESLMYTNKLDEICKIKELRKILEDINIKVYEASNKLVKSKYMIKVGDTYLINPIKFIYGLLNNNKFTIYENTSIIDIEKENNYYACYTKENLIKAKRVVVASHYPYFLSPLLFPLKASLEKSYLSASKYNMKPISLISYSNPFISIRNYKDYLIYLSNSHSINNDVNDKENYKELLKKLKDLKITPEYLWSNIDIITNDGLPYIGEINKNMYIGTGYNTWGLTNGFLAGSIISNLITNKDNKYIKLFNPKRKNISQITGSISDIFKNIDGYIKGYMKSDKNCPKCPHMGCKLLYNSIEKTWDCPCHGSRFDKTGKCISAPSNKDIDIKK